MRVMGYELTARQQSNIQTSRQRLNEGGREAESERDGIVRGHNYTFWPDTIRALKRDGRTEEALELVLECVIAAERDSSLWGGSIAIWYTEAAAIIYRKLKEFAAEIAILERYERNSRPRDRGVFSERIAKARALLARVSA